MIYKSKRIGKNGKEFWLFKFRTMRNEPGPKSTAEDDPRITKIGKFLRKTKLDELPQVWNLLKGDIGLVGWRPEDPQYLYTIPEEVLKTKPGIFGLATLWDIDEGAVLKGSSDPDKDYEEKILPKKRELEVQYVRNRSIALDIKILIQTIGRMIWKHTRN